MRRHETNSVENALLVLAGKCDGAATLDGQGFNAYDTGFGHQLVERVLIDADLTANQRAAAWRMMRKYREQLLRAGVDYAAIPNPEAAAVAQRDARATPARGSDQIRVYCKSGRIYAKTPFRLKDVVKAIPQSRWNPHDKAWTYPESPTQALTIADTLERYGMNSDEHFIELVKAAREQRAAQVHRKAENLPPPPITSAERKPWKHQCQGYWFAREQNAAMLAMEMGTGKSRLTIDLLQNYAAELGRPIRVLIACPPKVLGVWPKQFRLHAFDPNAWHVSNGTYRIARGRNAGKLATYGVAERLREFERLFYDCACGRNHVAIVNYEATTHEPLKGWRPRDLDYFVMDEIHKIKAPGGKWSKWCWDLSKTATRRLGLTGTPFPQGPLDIFAQYRALDAAIYGTSKTSFQKKYAEMGGYGGYEVLGLKDEAGLIEKFRSIAFEVGEEVLDLPSVNDMTFACELSREAARTYASIDSAMWAELEAGEITVANVLVRMLRLQQITGGAVNTDEGVTVEVDHSKADLLRETLEDIGNHKTVVFCRFTHDLAVVKREAEALSRRYMEVSGGRSDGLTEDSTLHPDADVVGVQIQAGGTGVDFTAAAHGIYYSLGFSLSDYLQSRRRLHRPGQEKPVRFVHLVVSGTIDEDVYDALRTRQEVIEYVLSEHETPHDPDYVDEYAARITAIEGDKGTLVDHAMADALGIFGG